MEVITLEQYGKRIGYPLKPETLFEIQDFAETDLDWIIWDYPLEEYDYVLNEVVENKDCVAIVQTEFGKRVCEV